MLATLYIVNGCVETERERERRGKWTNRAGEKGEGMKGEFDQNRYKSV